MYNVYTRITLIDNTLLKLRALKLKRSLKAVLAILESFL